jgi:hypothetical protein
MITVQMQVCAAAGDASALACVVDLYARHAVGAVEHGIQRLLAPLGSGGPQEGDLGSEVQQVVAGAIAAAAEMGAPGLMMHLLRLLPALGCMVVEEPAVGAAVQAALQADVSAHLVQLPLPCTASSNPDMYNDQ